MCLWFKRIAALFLVIGSVCSFAMTASGENSEKLVVPGGQSIGVSLRFAGIYVDSLGEIETEDGSRSSPVKKAGINAGDTIIAINGISAESVEAFEKILNSVDGENVTLTVKDKNGAEREASLTPIRSAEDGKLKIGAWIRDAASGVGTITYYDPQTSEFAAIGHSISDIGILNNESGAIGDVYKAEIAGVRKGEAGTPGELIGIYSENKLKIGEIESSSEYGIIGTVSNPENLISVRQPIPLGTHNDAALGEAYISSNVEGNKIRDFKIEIIEINHSGEDGKNIVFKVADEDLISKTGGIVCGMSGSPIIQNDKIIGSVTHVLVNEPTMGYGIFIENIKK